MAWEFWPCLNSTPAFTEVETRFADACSMQPQIHLLHGHSAHVQLVLLAEAHHFLVQSAGFFQGFDLVDRTLAQFHQVFHPFFGDANGPLGFHNVGTLYRAEASGFQLV